MFTHPGFCLLEKHLKGVEVIEIQMIFALLLQFTFKQVTDLLSRPAFSVLTASLNWSDFCVIYFCVLIKLKDNVKKVEVTLKDLET